MHDSADDAAPQVLYETILMVPLDFRLYDDPCKMFEIFVAMDYPELEYIRFPFSPPPFERAKLFRE
jgi:hypothetical protein